MALTFTEYPANRKLSSNIEMTLEGLPANSKLSFDIELTFAKLPTDSKLSLKNRASIFRASRCQQTVIQPGAVELTFAGLPVTANCHLTWS